MGHAAGTWSVGLEPQHLWARLRGVLANRSLVVNLRKVHARSPSSPAAIPMLPQLTRGPFVADRIDDEVIIVNLQSGIYYSLRKFGVDVWSGLEQGASRDDLLSELRQRHDLSDEQAEARVEQLLEDLICEGIVAYADADGGQRSADEDNGAQPAAEDPEGFRLQRFSDMEELLMLDPVHDVDDTGWPLKPKPE